MNQKEIRDRLNEIIEEYGDLYFDLDEQNARLMDWIILLHMDVTKILQLIKDNGIKVDISKRGV